MHSGFIAYNTVDSLSAFWPGLQVLAGDIESAIKAHMICACGLLSTFHELQQFYQRLATLETKLWDAGGLGHRRYGNGCVPVSSSTR